MQGYRIVVWNVSLELIFDLMMTTSNLLIDWQEIFKFLLQNLLPFYHEKLVTYFTQNLSLKAI